MDLTVKEKWCRRGHDSDLEASLVQERSCSLLSQSQCAHLGNDPILLLLLLLTRVSRVRLCVTPWTAAHQAPPSLGFSRQEHWSGLPFHSPMHKSEKWKWSHSVMSDSSQLHGLQPTRLPHPWDFPGKHTGVGCHCLLWNGLMDDSKFSEPGVRISGFRCWTPVSIFATLSSRTSGISSVKHLLSSGSYYKTQMR